LILSKSLIKNSKIFITPWIDLQANDIDKCILAGANSARIHTGKASLEKIIELINYYNSRDFQFYLDLRGNKTSIESIDNDLKYCDIRIGQNVFIGLKGEKPTGKCCHSFELGFIPSALMVKRNIRGNIALDDARIIINLKKRVECKGKVIGFDGVVTKEGRVWIGDGVSSTNLFIHSGSKYVLSFTDIDILNNIPINLRHKIKYIAISFCENSCHIDQAEMIVKSLGYTDAIIVPKVETIEGVKNIDKICVNLVNKYGRKAELQVGRSDLTADIERMGNKYNIVKTVDLLIESCQRHKVLISILAMIMTSVRLAHRLNIHTKIYEPTKMEEEYIGHLAKQKVYQIGLTNDMYIEHPEEMIEKLRDIISKY